MSANFFDKATNFWASITGGDAVDKTEETAVQHEDDIIKEDVSMILGDQSEYDLTYPDQKSFSKVLDTASTRWNKKMGQQPTDATYILGETQDSTFDASLDVPLFNLGDSARKQKQPAKFNSFLSGSLNFGDEDTMLAEDPAIDEVDFTNISGMNNPEDLLVSHKQYVKGGKDQHQHSINGEDDCTSCAESTLTSSNYDFDLSSLTDSSISSRRSHNSSAIINNSNPLAVKRTPKKKQSQIDKKTIKKTRAKRTPVARLENINALAGMIADFGIQEKGDLKFCCRYGLCAGQGKHESDAASSSSSHVTATSHMTQMSPTPLKRTVSTSSKKAASKAATAAIVADHQVVVDQKQKQISRLFSQMQNIEKLLLETKQQIMQGIDQHQFE